MTEPSKEALKIAHKIWDTAVTSPGAFVNVNWNSAAAIIDDAIDALCAERVAEKIDYWKTMADGYRAQRDILKGELEQYKSTYDADSIARSASKVGCDHIWESVQVPCPENRPGCCVMHYEVRCHECGVARNTLELEEGERKYESNN